MLATPAAALDPDRALAQYLRDAWGREQGFPGGPVYGLAQTSDGYLWIAAEKGLVRFDGIRFRLFEPSGSTSAMGPTVLGVAAASDGSLWARLRGPALVRLRDGAFEDILPTVGLPGSIVTAMLRGRDDAMLLATVGEGAVSYRSGATASSHRAQERPAGLVHHLARTDAERTNLVRYARCRPAASRGIARLPDYGGIAESEDQLPTGWRGGRSVDRHGPGCLPVEGWRNRRFRSPESTGHHTGHGNDSGPGFEPVDRGGPKRAPASQRARRDDVYCPRQTVRRECHCRLRRSRPEPLGWNDGRDRAPARRRVHDTLDGSRAACRRSGSDPRRYLTARMDRANWRGPVLAARRDELSASASPDWMTTWSIRLQVQAPTCGSAGNAAD